MPLARRVLARKTETGVSTRSIARYLLATCAILVSGCLLPGPSGNPCWPLHCAPAGAGPDRLDLPPSRRFRGRFQESEYAPYALSGSASIDGELEVPEPGGVFTEVWLKPATTFSREWWQRTVRHNVRLTTQEPWEQYDRHTTRDSDGHFHFDSLAAGSYFIVCYVLPSGRMPNFWVADSITLRLDEHGTVRLQAVK